MKTKTALLAFTTSLSIVAMSACARAPAPVPMSTATSGVQAPAGNAPGAAVPTATSAVDKTLPSMIVHKSASCGCCAAWVEHMQKAGFAVEVRNSDNINPVKQRVGVPLGQGSCHTAEVGGYFVEGHVPAADIKRLLTEQPDAKGLVVPGMPAGSPGMELPDGRVQAYTVDLVERDGTTTVFARHGQ